MDAYELERIAQKTKDSLANDGPNAQRNAILVALAALLQHEADKAATAALSEGDR